MSSTIKKTFAYPLSFNEEGKAVVNVPEGSFVVGMGVYTLDQNEGPQICAEIVHDPVVSEEVKTDKFEFSNNAEFDASEPIAYRGGFQLTDGSDPIFVYEVLDVEKMQKMAQQQAQ